MVDSFLEKAVPQLLPIIYELNSRVVRKYDDKSVAIIDDEKRVHMAHMDIHYGYSVNGVAYLHTEILKNTELNNFYKIYPEKFNNKTNGITFRRWLLHCNHELADLIESLIGPGFKKDAMELEKLGALVDDAFRSAASARCQEQQKDRAERLPCKNTGNRAG